MFQCYYYFGHSPYHMCDACESMFPEDQEICPVCGCKYPKITAIIDSCYSSGKIARVDELAGMKYVPKDYFPF